MKKTPDNFDFPVPSEIKVKLEVKCPACVIGEHPGCSFDMVFLTGWVSGSIEGFVGGSSGAPPKSRWCEKHGAMVEAITDSLMTKVEEKKR